MSASSLKSVTEDCTAQVMAFGNETNKKGKRRTRLVSNIYFDSLSIKHRPVFWSDHFYVRLVPMYIQLQGTNPNGEHLVM